MAANRALVSKADELEAKRAAKELADSPRPYRNHYAGLRLGACSTAQSAMVAAFKHLIYGEAAAATIVAPNDRDVCRMHWTTMGVSVWTDNVVRPAGIEPTKAIVHNPDTRIRRVA
jgi:hypothetical protein